MKAKAKKKSEILTNTRLSPDDILYIKNAIEDAGGSEVLSAVTVGDDNVWGFSRILARGNENSAPAVIQSLRPGDVLLHNHPSGTLYPSEADMHIASICGKSGIGFAIHNNACSAMYVVVEPYIAPEPQNIDTDEMLSFISKDGAIAAKLPNFEERKGQKDMMAKITEALNSSCHAILEGETGIGKSMAYLIPSIHYAIKNNCRVAISTNTINLQHQLINKDLPFLAKVLPFDFQYRLLKGRQNYICIRKTKEAIASDGTEFLLEANEFDAFNRLVNWADTTNDGSLSDLNWVPPDSLWEKLCCDKDSCPGIRCTQYDECFFYTARRAATDAQLLIVNHHLLFSDLALRANTKEYSQTAVIPACKCFILDEAHNLEETATKHFGFRTASLGIQRLLNKIYVKKGRRELGAVSVIYGLLAFGHGNYQAEDRAKILQDINEVIIPARVEIGEISKDLFDTIARSLVTDDPPKQGEYRLRIGQKEANSQNYEIIKTKAFRLRDESKRLGSRLKTLCKKVGNGTPEEDSEKIRFDIPLTELTMYSARLEEICIAINTLFGAVHDGNDPFVHFFTTTVRRSGIFTSFQSMPIEVSKPMVEYCFSKIPCAVLVSGTLSTAHNFNFIKNRLGLDSDELETKPLEGRFASPFSYENQTRLFVPTDLPDPSDPLFAEYITTPLIEMILASKGGALVLCTSYVHLNQLYKNTSQTLFEYGFDCYKQGDLERHHLLDLFKEDGNAVLFATDSFWEGVDVPGSALRNLIIVKLPFASPSDPVLEARNERLKASGKNAFNEYQMPIAALKLKQGFGRLIRTKTDRGTVWILDRRLITKSYGKFFIESLPPAPVMRGKMHALLEMARKFHSDFGVI